MAVGDDQTGGGGGGQYPPGRIVAIHSERAGEDLFLVQRDVEKQLAGERLGTLSIAGIKNAIAAVEDRKRLGLRA